eukprot:scaffold12665_cov37-Attheya_sp.AAC.1
MAQSDPSFASELPVLPTTSEEPPATTIPTDHLPTFSILVVVSSRHPFSLELPGFRAPTRLLMRGHLDLATRDDVYGDLPSFQRRKIGVVSSLVDSAARGVPVFGTHFEKYKWPPSTKSPPR